MSAIRDTIKKVRFEQGQQSLASPFQFEEGLQTPVPTRTLIRNKIREVRERPKATPFLPKQPKIVRDQSFKDVVNMFVEIPASFASIVVSPALSIIEASKGKALGDIKIPLPFQNIDRKQEVIFRGVQTDYNKRIQAGEDAESAFWKSSLSFGLDLTFAIGTAKGILKSTLVRKSPETLIKRTAFEKS